jgi:hypothetical protein
MGEMRMKVKYLVFSIILDLTLYIHRIGLNMASSVTKHSHQAAEANKRPTGKAHMSVKSLASSESAQYKMGQIYNEERSFTIP